MREEFERRPLGEVCDVYQPQTISKKEMKEDGEYPVFGANGIIGSYDKYNHEFPQVLVTCRGATCGYVNVSSPKSWVTGNAMVVRPRNENIDLKYLEYFLRGGVDYSEVITGSAQPQITRKSLSPVKISYPELIEQKRIVSILDDAFEGIDSVLANTEKNFDNARELFESYLNSMFIREREKSHEKSLGDICFFENGDRGKNYPNRNEYTSDGVPWINTGHINSDGTLSLENMNFISAEKYESLRSGKIKPGDLVYCLRGATLGKTALVSPLKVGAVASSLVIIRPSEVLDSRYLYFFLISPVGRSFIEKYGNGAAQPNLGAKSVAKYRIPVPVLRVQEEIVIKLTDVAKESQELVAIYGKKKEALAELKQSLLRKAFSGELTAKGAEAAVEEATA